MHKVLFEESVELLGKELFPESIKQVHGGVEVDVVPCPVEVGYSLPSDPGVAASHVTKEAAFKGPIVGAPLHFPRDRARELVNELIQVSHPGQPGPCPEASLDLILKT